MRKIYEAVRDNGVISTLIFGVVSGAISGILFATGFGAIALSIFISLLICGLLLLAREYMTLKDSMMTFMEMTRQTFNSMSESFAQEIQDQQEGHHEDIQGVYLALSNILGEEE